MEVGNDGAPVVSGFPYNGTGGSAFLKADPDGAQLWLNADADGPNNFLLHAQMMLDAQNNAYLCAGTLFAMGICKVNADGSSAWYITAGSGNAQGFALGTDGGVYVVGGSTLKLEQDITTNVAEVASVQNDGVHAFPNPVTDRLNVEWPHHVIDQWRILAASGAVLAEGRWLGAVLDIAHLPTGHFILELVDPSGARARSRLLKE